MKKSYLSYISIFIFLFIAFSPVILSSNYIRQDDLMWEIWPGMKMSDFGFIYQNIVFQLVRPICMVLLYFADLTSINIHDAVYIRLLSVTAIGLLGIAIFRWQLLFNPNRLLAASYAVAVFTLPAMQVFAATANYFLILFALLLTFAGAFLWFKAFTNAQARVQYITMGSVLFFISLLTYPLSSMYIWVLLTIGYLNTTFSSQLKSPISKNFTYFTTSMTIAVMALFFAFIVIFHKIYPVDSSYRSATVDTHNLFTRLLRIFDILAWHGDLWAWHQTHSWQYSPIILIYALFIAASVKAARVMRTKVVSQTIKVLGITFAFFFISYSPIFATPEVTSNYRYTITTMPILLYFVFWSIHTLSKDRKITNIISNVLLILLASTGVVYANLMLAERIVGPHEHDFAYLQERLADEVLPLLKANQQVIIHAIDCDNGKRYNEYNAPNFEYGMRICQYQQQIIGVIIHSLNKLGYASNFHRKNAVTYNKDEIIVNDIPWGTIIVNNRRDDKYIAAGKSVITIDTKDMPPYKPFEFYNKRLFES